MSIMARGKHAKGPEYTAVLVIVLVVLALAAAAVWFFMFSGKGGDKGVSSAAPVSDTIEVSSEETQSVGEYPDDVWRLLLVNSSHPLPEGFTVQLSQIKDFSVDERIQLLLEDMMAAAKKDGCDLALAGGYRENAKDEYATGLAVDIVRGNWYKDHKTLNNEFTSEKEYQWLTQHAADYGFILRYPQGKESVTGKEFESWHYRFVGVIHAKAMRDSGQSLEEYLEGRQ